MRHLLLRAWPLVPDRQLIPAVIVRAGCIGREIPTLGIDSQAPHHHYSDMTASEFTAWLVAMNISGAEAARRLGCGKNAITRFKRQGGDRRLALACSALYHRLEPWK